MQCASAIGAHKIKKEQARRRFKRKSMHFAKAIYTGVKYMSGH